jgi:nitrite reductase/ring-hydroxylating ferredoxin subunit
MVKQVCKSGSCRDGALERRQFLQGSLGLFGAVPLCCTTPEIRGASVRFEGTTLWIDLEQAPELHAVGSAVAVVDASRKLDLIIVHTGKGQFAALDRSCTHSGAQCTYSHKRRTVQCTSLNHAEYDLAGTLLHGRTHGNLRTYQVRHAGALIEIRLEV